MIGKESIKVLCNTQAACKVGDISFALCEMFCNDNKGPDGWHAFCEGDTCCCVAPDLASTQNHKLIV